MLWCSPRTSCWWIGWSYLIFFLCTWWLNTSKTVVIHTRSILGFLSLQRGGEWEGKCHILSSRSCALQVWAPVWNFWMSSWRNWGLLFIIIQDSEMIWQRLEVLQEGHFNLGIQLDFQSTVILFCWGFYVILALCLRPTWKDNSWVREVCPLSPWFSEKTANKPGNCIWVNHKTKNL